MVCHPSSQRRDPPFSMSLRRQTACVVRSSQWAARLLLPSSVGRLLLLAESQRRADPYRRPQYCESCRFERSLGTNRTLKQHRARPQSVRRLFWRASERTSVPLTIVLDRRHGFCLSTLVLRSRATCGSRLLRSVPMPGGRHPASHQRGDETLSYLSGKGLDRSSRAPLAVSR
jgi:hypothetical protein